MLNILGFLLNLVDKYTIWLYASCLLLVLFHLRSYLLARRARTNTIFSIEKEVAAHSEGRAMSNISTWKYYLPAQANRLKQDIEADSGAGIIPMNERFHKQQSVEEPNFNSSWETTYHHIYEARFLVESAMAKGLPDVIENSLQELEYQLQYAELTINLYDNIITFFTQRGDEQVIREEALLRLQNNMEKLGNYEIKSPALGVTNGLEASGVQDLVDKMVAEHPQLFTQR